LQDIFKGHNGELTWLGLSASKIPVDIQHMAIQIQNFMPICLLSLKSQSP
jgi:hypothetical protein